MHDQAIFDNGVPSDFTATTSRTLQSDIEYKVRQFGPHRKPGVVKFYGKNMAGVGAALTRHPSPFVADCDIKLMSRSQNERVHLSYLLNLERLFLFHASDKRNCFTEF